MKIICATIAPAFAFVLMSATAASAAALAVGQYLTTGTVTSATSQCSAVGLSANAANDSVLTYPGAGKTGLTIYVPGSGVLQLCSGFPAVPTTGLTNFSATGKCAIYSTNGTIPAQPVTFDFKTTVINAFSSIGTTTISIPTTDTLGGGCTATVSTSTVFSGAK
jgi:hypothetical protein